MSTKKKIILVIIGVEAVVIAAVIAFLFYINSDIVKINRQLELAQRYLIEEDYEQAIAAFEVIIEIDPKNAEAYLGIAEAYAATDDLESAVKILEKGSRRTDSEEILEMLEVHTAEIEQRVLIAQKAAEADAAADASQINPTETAGETPATQPDEPVVDIFSIWQKYVRSTGETSAYFVLADYDGDGIKEAFAVTGTFDGEMGYLNAKIYFINAEGDISCVCDKTYSGDSLYGYMHEGHTGDYLLETAISKFIVWEVSAYGSGSISIILGVKDGMAYEPDISNCYMDFGLNEANQFAGYSSDFSKGFHDYIEHIFVFDENSGQFILQ